MMWIVRRSRFRILRYLVVIVPLVLTLFSVFSESLTSWLLSRYELRWHVEDHDDARKQIITVTNNGDAPVSRARLLLHIDSTKPRPVADFAFGREDGTPRISFFNHLIAEDPFPPASNAELEQLMMVFDRHSSSRTLVGIEKAFDQILSSKLKAKEPFLKLVADMEKRNPKFDDWHRDWSQECKTYRIPPPSCQEGSNLLASWENSKRDLLVKGQRRWYEATGVALVHESNDLSPEGDVDLTFDLGGNESAVVEIHYNNDPSLTITPKIEFSSSSIAQTTRVKDKSYLSAPLPAFMFKHHFTTLAIVVAIATVLLWFAWPAIIPKQLLTISRVFRIALNEDDHEYWDYALQRHRFHILQQFRDLRVHFNKQQGIENEEILDYVRHSLIKAYDKDPRKLRTDRRLNLVIRSALRMFVAASP